jgi:hypothetical protein
VEEPLLSEEVYRLRGIIVYGLIAALLLVVTCCTHSQPGELPLGYVDVKPDPNITGVVSLAGWAAAEGGISKVCLYVDRQATSCTESITVGRPDVAAAYPHIAGAGTSGWSIQFDSSGLSPGNHEFVIQATTKSGATRDLGSMNVAVSK